MGLGAKITNIFRTLTFSGAMNLIIVNLWFLLSFFYFQNKINRLPAYLTIQFVRFYFKEKEAINAKILKVRPIFTCQKTVLYLPSVLGHLNSLSILLSVNP